MRCKLKYYIVQIGENYVTLSALFSICMNHINKRLFTVALINAIAIMNQLIIALNMWRLQNSCRSSRWPLEGDSAVPLEGSPPASQVVCWRIYSAHLALLKTGKVIK